MTMFYRTVLWEHIDIQISNPLTDVALMYHRP